MKKWVKFCESRNMRPVRFSHNVPTHWNSTYKLFCQFDEYKEMLCILCVIMLVILFCILHNGMCTKIYQLLKVFTDASNTLFGVYYLTSNLFIIKTLTIVGVFDECMCQEPELKTCIEVMKSK